MSKNITRFITLFLALCICVCCAACGGESPKPSNDKGKPQNSISTPVVEDNSSNVSSNNSSNISSGNTSNTSTNNTSSYPEVLDSQRPYYKPTSITLSLYDTAASSYGFTWNSEFEPIDPVIQICEGEKFNKNTCKEYKATVKIEAVNMPSLTYIYVCKVAVKLKQNTTYTYRAYDKGAQATSNKATFTTGNLTANSFKFVHVSDSQVTGSTDDYSGDGTGEYFANTLKGIMQSTPDFMLHTGDFVEYSKYEGYWKNMLDFNVQYLMKLPVMAISGNHETSYRAGVNETFKHFNVKIPTQETKFGYYYSFNYGNAKFIMLNTNNLIDNKLEPAQYNWLEKELKNNNKKWTIVSLHNPMYSVGNYGADSSKNYISLALRAQLTKLFVDCKVDLVLQGHDHVYSKTFPIKADGMADTNPIYETVDSVKYTVNPTGTIYSMHGPAGNQARSPYSVDSGLYEIAAKSNTNSWAEISIEDNRLTVHIKYFANGTVNTFESYGIIKK